MKTLIFLLFCVAAQAQSTIDSQRIFEAINDSRTAMSLPPLVYRLGEQIALDQQAVQISYTFDFDDSCECDYESIAGSKTLEGLIKKLTSRRYDWFHFADDAQYAAIGVVERNGIHYAVVRVYKE